MIEKIISGISSRVGMIAIALVAGFLAGHSAASKGAAIRRLNDEVSNLRAALARTEAAAEQAAREADRLRAHQAAIQETLHAYETELSQRPDVAACRLTDADLERLRKLK